MSQMTERLLAIYSHPDDELGAVGTLSNHSERGDKVVILWLTRGEGSSVVQGKKESIARKRMERAKQVARMIGAEARFLGIKDTEVLPTREYALQIAEQIREVRPTIILTWGKTYQVGAGHPDHRYCFDLVMDAISLCRYKQIAMKYPAYRETLSVYIYPGESTNFKEVFVDVSDQVEKIKEVIRIYSEEYKGLDVEDRHLTRLRANGYKANVKFAEVFQQVQTRAACSRFLK